jgi:DNA-binding transcriptional regulator YdaS (Cro superfamily)
MRLTDYLKSLSAQERKDFADRCETSLDYLWQVANGVRTPKTKLAVAITRESAGRVPCAMLLQDVDWDYLRQHLMEPSAPAEEST